MTTGWAAIDRGGGCRGISVVLPARDAAATLAAQLTSLAPRCTTVNGR